MDDVSRPPPPHQPFGKFLVEALDQAVTHAATGYLRRRGYQVAPPENIDTSDIPEANEDWFRRAKIRPGRADE